MGSSAIVPGGASEPITLLTHEWHLQNVFHISVKYVETHRAAVVTQFGIEATNKVSNHT